MNLGTTVTQAVEARRATASFDPSFKIERSELAAVLRLASLSPSALDLQPCRFLVARSPESKAKVSRASFDQTKVEDASAVVVVLGDRRFFERIGEVVRLGLENGSLNERKAAEWTDLAQLAYAEKPKRVINELFRATGLWAATFMLLAQEAGWDTAPIGGFDEAAMREEFGIEDRYLPTLVVAVGRTTGHGPRPPRFALEETVDWA